MDITREGLILVGDTGNLLGTDFNHSSLPELLALTHPCFQLCPTDKMEPPLNVLRKYVAQLFVKGKKLQNNVFENLLKFKKNL